MCPHTHMLAFAHLSINSKESTRNEIVIFLRERKLVAEDRLFTFAVYNFGATLMFSLFPRINVEKEEKYNVTLN